MNQGMIKQNIFQRFELLFWNLAIRVLSGSRTARQALSPLVRAASHANAQSLSLVLTLCGMAGLVTGYLLFVATH